MNAKQRAKLELLRGQIGLIIAALEQIENEESDKSVMLDTSNLGATVQASDIFDAMSRIGAVLEKLRECDEYLEALSQPN